jgi:hypothetical protein
MSILLHYCYGQLIMECISEVEQTMIKAEGLEKEKAAMAAAFSSPLDGINYYLSLIFSSKCAFYNIAPSKTKYLHYYHKLATIIVI